jgi:hypothetical protein
VVVLVVVVIVVKLYAAQYRTDFDFAEVLCVAEFSHLELCSRRACGVCVHIRICQGSIYPAPVNIYLSQ